MVMVSVGTPMVRLNLKLKSSAFLDASAFWPGMSPLLFTLTALMSSKA